MSVLAQNFFVAPNEVGGGCTNGHLNHMKDIHELEDTQPRLFNHVCYMIKEAGREGPGHTLNNTISRMPILNQDLTDHRKPTGSPQTLPPKQHSIKTHTMTHPQHDGMTHFLGGWSNTTFTIRQLATVATRVRLG